MTIVWNEEKNDWLKANRGIGFEQVAVLIEQGMVLDIVEHPNQTRYPGQKIAILELMEYVFLVPYEIRDKNVVLKTIIPSRKMTKKYFGR